MRNQVGWLPSPPIFNIYHEGAFQCRRLCRCICFGLIHGSVCRLELVDSVEMSPAVSLVFCGPRRNAAVKLVVASSSSSTGARMIQFNLPNASAQRLKPEARPNSSSNTAQPFGRYEPVCTVSRSGAGAGPKAHAESRPRNLDAGARKSLDEPERNRGSREATRGIALKAADIS